MNNESKHTKESIREGHGLVTSPQHNCPFYQHVMVSRITDLTSAGVQPGIQRYPVRYPVEIRYFPLTRFENLPQ